jgi:hypothetical protein
MSSIYPVPLRARPHAACTPKKRPANSPAVPFQFYSDLVPPSTVRSATAVKTATAVRTTTATEAAATLAMETPTAIPSEAGAAARAAVKSPAAANAAIRIAASTHCGAPVECAAPNKSAATVQPAIKATVVIPASIKSAIVISTSIKPAPKSVEPRTGSDEDSVDEIIRPPESIRSARIWRVIVITVVADRRCAVSVTISATDSNSYRYLGV